MNQIIVSMTSYPKRIKYVSIVINDFLSKQTIKPNIFYLWLSQQDFPNKQNDLPLQLLESIQKYKIKLQWLKDNLYSFKRFMVYPQHYDDYCIFIDDDVLYSPQIIQNCLNVLKQYPKTICNLWIQFTAIPIFQGIKRTAWGRDFSSIKNIKNWMCGNCMIPPNVFPLECLEYIDVFKKYANGNDELFLIPFVIKNNIEISFNPVGYPFNELNGSQQQSVHKSGDELINGIAKHDICLFNILKETNTLQYYQKIYINYNR